MHLTTLLTVFSFFCSSALAASSSFPPDLSHGLGISLSSGYGTVSAYFPNGTYVNIAKVEGDRCYKAYMRDRIINSTIDCATGRLSSESLARCPLPGHLCRQWFSEQRTPRPLSPMISRLKAAAQARLEKCLCMVEIGVPHTASNGHGDLQHHISVALHDSSLFSIRYPHNNGEFAAHAHGLHGNCPSYTAPWSPNGDIYDNDDHERFVLTVENTRASLTATLWLEHYGDYMLLDQVHSGELGQNSLVICRCLRQASNNSKICDDNLEDAVMDVVHWPVRNGFFTDKEIEGGVVFGEGSEDQRLIDIIKKVLRRNDTDNVVGNLINQGDVDPTFAAANALAEHSWQSKVSSMEPQEPSKLILF